MTSVVLGNAELALISDLANQRVTIPHLTAITPGPTYAGTTVLFAGDVYDTPFRGLSKSKQWPLTARYRKDEHAQMVALLDLIDLAASSPDSRLLLRTHYGLVAGIDEALAVVIFAVQPVPQMGQYFDVSFTAKAVNWSPAV